MAFQTVPSPAHLHQTTFLPSTSPRHATPTSHIPRRIPTARASQSSPPPREYRTMSDPTPHPDHTGLSARVIRVTSLCPARDHLQVTLDVSRIGLSRMHTAPGQFVQLSREVSSFFGRKPVTKACFATIASPPGGPDGVFEFLVGAKNDPLGLGKLKEGDLVGISPVMGNGLDIRPVVQSDGNLYMFADAPQGFAAAKSLIEWGEFRAASGEGANRTNHVTIYYAIPSGKSLPYADRFSSWSVYGVNIVPLPGISILEYLSVRDTVGTASGGRGGDFAMACVSSDETYEALFCSLVLFGFRRSAIHRYTQEVVAGDVQAFDESEDFDASGRREEKPFGMPEDVYQQMKRDNVEREIWQSWVGVRESMRAEFERKWAAQAKMDREAKRSAKEKQQAWDSWFMKNDKKWDQVAWDNDQWSQYWSSWKETQETWTGKNDSWWGETAQKKKKGSEPGREAWNQAKSQEYWDWVGQGVGRGGSSASRGSQGSSDDFSDWYERHYGGSNSWGNANNRGYEPGGYRYQYEEPKKDTKDHNGYTGRAKSGSSGSGWSGWNRNKSNKRSSGQRDWSTNKNSPIGDLDFYSVLGIESGASRADIKRAYRRKAMRHHPDRNPDNSEEAHMKMKQIVVAWSVLKDEGKRQKYDKYGPNGL